MLLLVGLGNPGPEYARQRHNVGFIAVDAIHRRHGFQPWRRRFSGEIAEGTLAGEKVLLLKPLTYMNDSGRSVQDAARFYKLEPRDVFVIHDEVDLPPGATATGPSRLLGLLPPWLFLKFRKPSWKSTEASS